MLSVDEIPSKYSPSEEELVFLQDQNLYIFKSGGRKSGGKVGF